MFLRKEGINLEYTTLSDAIEDILSESFSLSENILFEYLIKRYMLLNKITRIKNINLEDFSHFISNILCIKPINNKFYFNGIEVSVDSCVDESIFNVIVNWPILSFLYRKLLFPGDDKIVRIESYCLKIINRAKRKSYKIKAPYKKYFYANIVLTELNNAYSISPKFPMSEKYFAPLKDESIAMRTQEDICKEYVKSMYFSTKDNTLVSEKDIEDYIYKNFNVYFPQLKLLGRQVSLENGYTIDLLADDKTNVYIVEIKNKKDDRLYWQAINYYKLYKKHTDKKIKVITIAPEYSDEMIKSLKSLKYVTIKSFVLRLESGKISNLEISKV